jgi:glycogen synthase
VKASAGDEAFDLSLYEGKAVLSGAQLLVIGAPTAGRARTAALLGSAVKSLADDSLIAPEVTIAWGETAAAALSATSAAVRIFVLPSGRVGPTLSDDDARVLGIYSYGDASVGHSLVALGATSANAIIAPSPSAARELETDPGLMVRASDEPLVAIRFGSDDPPHDPNSDPALIATYSASALSGKTECRRALARRCSLALGAQTLLLVTAPLQKARGGEVLVSALQRLASHDVVVVVPGIGDPELLERVQVLAIEQSGRLAVISEYDQVTDRQVRAAADAVLLGDEDDRTARAAALAQTYGALPIALDAGACRDYLVDYDPRSGTGSALLYGSLTPFEVESAIRRAISLRADGDLWSPLVRGLLQGAPRWVNTATAIEEISAQFV